MAYKILIIDGSQWMRELLTETLRRSGYGDVVSCESGTDGLERFRSEKPDLILSDTLAPGMDGVALCKKIRQEEKERHTPIFLISGIYKSEDFRKKILMESGAQEYLDKPIQFPLLLDLIRKHLSPESAAQFPEMTCSREDMEAHSCSRVETKTFDLTENFIAHILYDQYCNRVNGFLTCRNSEVTKIFYLLNGGITFARSNCPEDRLGNILLSSGIIHQQQLSRALEIQKGNQGRTRIGDILVEECMLSRKDLEKAIISQIVSMIMSVFAWESGTAILTCTELKPEEKIHLDIFPLNLILAALQKTMIPEWRLGKFLPDENSVLRRTRISDEMMNKLTLTTIEKQTLEFVGEAKKISEICSIGPLLDLDMGTIAFRLLSVGLLQQESAASRAKSRPDSDQDHEIQVKIAGEEHGLNTMEGTLDKTPFPALLATLFFTKKTGVLHVESGHEKKWLHFEDGNLIFANSNTPEDRIGQMLLAAKKITPEEIDRAIDIQNKADRPIKFGSVLMKMGVLNLKEFHWAITLQAMRVTKSLFPIREGRYSFKETEFPREEKVTLRLNVMNLIMQGIREMDAAVLQAHYLPPSNSVLAKKWDSEELTKELNLTSLELKFLDMIQNGSTIGDVLNFPFLGRRDTVRTLYAVLTVGLIRVMGSPEKNAAYRESPLTPGCDLSSRTVPMSLYEKLLEEKRLLEEKLEEEKKRNARFRDSIASLENKGEKSPPLPMEKSI